MNTHDLNLNQLEIFASIVQKKGISAAARFLRLSPAAVSKQLKGLEEVLKIQLVRRTSTQFEVTEAGELFYSQCMRVSEEITRLKNFAESCSQEPSGELKVFSAAAFGEKYILPYLEEFARLYPNVLLTLDLADRYADVRKEGIDLCFGLLGHWDEELIGKKLFATNSCLLASPAYLSRHGSPKSRAELVNHRFICHANRPEPMVISFKSGEQVLVSPSILVNNHHALMSCALNGLGVIQYYQDFVEEAHLANGQLIPVLPFESMPELNCYAFYPPNRHLRPAVRVMLDFIVSKIGSIKRG